MNGSNETLYLLGGMIGGEPRIVANFDTRGPRWRVIDYSSYSYTQDQALARALSWAYQSRDFSDRYHPSVNMVWAVEITGGTGYSAEVVSMKLASVVTSNDSTIEAIPMHMRGDVEEYILSNVDLEPYRAQMVAWKIPVEMENHLLAFVSKGLTLKQAYKALAHVGTL